MTAFRHILTSDDLAAVLEPGVRYTAASLAKITGYPETTVKPLFDARGLMAIERVAPLQKPLVASQIPDVWEILQHVAEQYDVSIPQILGPSHDPYIVEPRHEAMAVVYELNSYTLKQLAEIFNKTDNGVLNGIKAHFRRLETRGPGGGW